MLSAIPVPGKGHDVHVHVAKQVLQFLSHLGYSEMQLRGDNEPSMEQMLNTIMIARQKHGLKTQVVRSQPYVRESNGVAEQAIQNLRDIAVTHLAQLKEASGHEVSAINDLLGWALVHAAFVHNTFKVQGGTTPYEKCFGVQYHGRLARFGETVMCALATKHIKKGKPRFVKVIWLGKTLSGDLHLCGTSVGVYLSSCIRRNNGERTSLRPFVANLGVMALLSWVLGWSQVCKIDLQNLQLMRYSHCRRFCRAFRCR